MPSGRGLETVIQEDYWPLQWQQTPETCATETVIEYKPPLQTCDSSFSLLNQLYNIFACFESDNNSLAKKIPSASQQSDDVAVFSVKSSLKNTNKESPESQQYYCLCPETVLGGSHKF